MAPKPLTAQAVADLVGGRLSGPGDVMLQRVRSLGRAEAGALTMCTGSRYADAMARTQASAVLVPEELRAAAGPDTRIVVADPGGPPVADGIRERPGYPPAADHPWRRRFLSERPQGLTESLSR